nr:hypothetical protein BdHM001_35670 [Bdellovibrio sp. HM001]
MGTCKCLFCNRPFDPNNTNNVGAEWGYGPECFKKIVNGEVKMHGVLVKKPIYDEIDTLAAEIACNEGREQTPVDHYRAVLTKAHYANAMTGTGDYPMEAIRGIRYHSTYDHLFDAREKKLLDETIEWMEKSLNPVEMERYILEQDDLADEVQKVIKNAVSKNYVAQKDRNDYIKDTDLGIAVPFVRLGVRDADPIDIIMANKAAEEYETNMFLVNSAHNMPEEHRHVHLPSDNLRLLSDDGKTLDTSFEGAVRKALEAQAVLKTGKDDTFDASMTKLFNGSGKEDLVKRYIDQYKKDLEGKTIKVAGAFYPQRALDENIRNNDKAGDLQVKIRSTTNYLAPHAKQLRDIAEGKEKITPYSIAPLALAPLAKYAEKDGYSAIVIKSQNGEYRGISFVKAHSMLKDTSSPFEKAYSAWTQWSGGKAGAAKKAAAGESIHIVARGTDEAIYVYCVNPVDVTSLPEDIRSNFVRVRSEGKEKGFQFLSCYEIGENFSGDPHKYLLAPASLEEFNRFYPKYENPDSVNFEKGPLMLGGLTQSFSLSPLAETGNPMISDYVFPRDMVHRLGVARYKRPLAETLAIRMKAKK